MLDTLHGSLDTITAKEAQEPFSAKYKLQPINVNLFAKARGSLPLPRPGIAAGQPHIIPAPSSPSFRIKNSPMNKDAPSPHINILNEIALNNDSALALDSERD